MSRQEIQGLEVPFPLGGVSETLTLEKQAASTCESALNMRGMDSRTRRWRGAKRCGSNRWMPDPIGPFAPARKVQRGITLAYQNKLAVYTEAASGSEPVRWTQTATEDTTDPIVGIKRDWQENVFALQGTGTLTKFNSDGKRVWTFKVPIKGKGHVARAFEIDPNLGLLFVGVSEADEQSEAELFCIQEKAPALDEEEEDELVPEILWDMKLNLFIEQIRHRGPYLVLGCNDELRHKSYVITLAGKDTEDPLEKQRYEVPYPLYGMDVKKNGEVYTTSPRNDDRYKSTYQPGAMHSIVVGKPNNFIVGWSDRLWSWHKADDWDGAGATSKPDGGSVNVWRDLSGHGRHFFEDTKAPSDFPKVRKPGYNGLTTVSFVSDHATTSQSLMSGVNWTIQPSQANSQRTLIPAYTGARFAVFMAFRPNQEGAVNADVGTVFHQDTTDPGAGVRALAVNQQDAVFPTVNSGTARLVEPAGGGTGGSVGLGGAWTNFWSFANSQRMVILSWIVSAGAPPWPAGSRIRVNGTPIDDYTAVAMTSMGLNQETFLGRAVGGAVDQGFNGEIIEMIVLREDLTTSPVLPKVTDAEIDALEGYLAWKCGVAGLLPGVHPYALANGPPKPKKGAGAATVWAELIQPGQQLVKWSPAGNPYWVLQDSTVGNGQQGLGYDVRVWEQKDKPTRVYTLGSRETLGAAAPQFHACAVVDVGATVPLTFAWRQSLSSSDWDYTHPRCDVDAFGNVHIPRAFPLGTSPAQLLSNELTPAVSHEPDDLPDIPLTVDKPRVYCVVAGRKVEYYDQDIAINEYVVCGDEVCRVHRVDYVTSVPAAPASVRTFEDFAIVGGRLWKFTTAGYSAPNGEPNFASLTAHYHDLAIMANEVVATDGDTYKVFNPLREPYWQPGDGLVAGGAVRNFVAKKGKIPPRCSLLAPYRGRLMVARSAEDPASWACSRAKNHYDWEFDPYLRDGNEAVASFNSLAFQCPDIINTLVPLGDDRLVFGCDHELWMLDGDPAQGGVLVQLSRITGMAFGKSWCQGPDGTVFFFGSRGGLYALRGLVVTPISDSRLPLTLRNIDLAVYKVQLEWNDELQGVHIFLFPYADDAIATPGYFWEPATNAFWPDSWENTSVQPTAAWLRDGDDPADRRMMLGCQDGRARYVDPETDTDDQNGTPATISGFVRLGPLTLPRDSRGHVPREVVLRYLEGLFALYGPCSYRIYASAHPEHLGKPVAQGDFNPGANDRAHLSISGRYVYIDLLAAGKTPKSSHWAFEALTVGVLEGGITSAR